MKIKLTCIIKQKHKDDISFQFEYSGLTKKACIDQIDTLPYHKHNLENYGKTKFKSADGAKHEWRIEDIDSLN